MMNVMLVDPSGDAYGYGLARGLDTQVNLLYITRINNIEKTLKNGKVYFFFYDGEADSRIKKIKKGIIYLFTYLRIVSLVCRKEINVIHFEWLLVPKVDLAFLNIFKKRNIKLVFTAHNVIPHRKGELYINSYRKIYKIFDSIIVHGAEIKEEFIHYFPEYKQKLSIQHHGVYVGQSVEFDNSLLKTGLLKRIEDSSKVVIFFGNMFYNKGVDRVVNHWLTTYKDSRYFFIIVGKKDPEYLEINRLEQTISECSNIYYYPHSVSELMLNTLINLSDFIIMPYRHASMSGIIFKAAEMKKTILSTDVGSIREYINTNICYITKNDDETLLSDFDNILENVSKQELAEKGISLNRHIHENFDWSTIAARTISEVYNAN